MPSLSFTPLVAVVEDNAGFRIDLTEFLQLNGYAVRGFESAEAFFRVWPAVHFDLLLLDIGLPGISGLEVASRVRERDSVGIVMLTAFRANSDQVAGLDAGADIYLPKGSALEVIEAACRSVLRRVGMEASATSASPAYPAWRFDLRRWRLEAPDGSAIEISHSEAALLAELCKQPGQAVAREQLLACLGKPDTQSNLRNLENAISRLRRKVHEACGVEFPVRPSYGRGYTFVGECEVMG